jgi:hypothetical protein
MNETRIPLTDAEICLLKGQGVFSVLMREFPRAVFRFSESLGPSGKAVRNRKELHDLPKS